MTVDGGTLLYGVDEDENGRVTLAAPIELAGQRERIDQIVQTSIMEPPTIYVSELPREEAPEQGYLLVTVPQSPRAPHQVVVGNDLRYYGRGTVSPTRWTTIPTFEPSAAGSLMVPVGSVSAVGRTITAK